MTENITYHVPVLLAQSIEGMNIKPDSICVDVTFGGGGHSKEILKHLSPEGHLYSFDQDDDAERNIIDDERFTFVRSNFRYLHNFMRYHGVEQIDAVSSHHLDDSERGFSFRFSGPLDMRMNKRADMTAADIVNEYKEEDLANIFYLYGELKNGRQLAQKIAKARTSEKIETTEQFLEIIKPLFGRDFPEEWAFMLADLLGLWAAKIPRNQIRMRYYNGKNVLKDFGISIPPQLLDVETIVEEKELHYVDRNSV